MLGKTQNFQEKKRLQDSVNNEKAELRTEGDSTELEEFGKLAGGEDYFSGLFFALALSLNHKISASG